VRAPRTALPTALASALLAAVALTGCGGPPSFDEDAPDTAALLARVGDGSNAFAVDLEALEVGPGIDTDARENGELLGYLAHDVFRPPPLEPLTELVSDHLVRMVTGGPQAYFVLDVEASEVEDALLEAEWERDGDLLIAAGSASIRMKTRAGQVRVEQYADHTLLGLASDDSEPPADGPVEVSGAAALLTALGGDTGFAVTIIDEPCTPTAASLESTTNVVFLVVPPDGTAAREVSAEDLTAPDGVTSIERVEPAEVDEGLLRVSATVEDPGVPVSLLTRLGLPSAAFC